MLTNLRLRFDAVEDRLTLRLTVQQANDALVDHVLHLTRRVCATWRQDLQAMIDLSAQAPPTTAPATKAAISNAHHEAMASQAKVRTEVVEPEESGSRSLPRRPPFLPRIAGRRGVAP